MLKAEGNVNFKENKKNIIFNSTAIKEEINKLEKSSSQ